MSIKLVFDADIVPYRFGFKHEDTGSWWEVQSDVDKWFEGIFDKFKTGEHVCYLTGDNNFRKDIAVSYEYKGNRTKEKPKWHPHIENYLIHCYNTEVSDGMEADDLVAIELTSNPSAIHIGIDKDLLQVRGWHYRYATHNSPEVGLRWVDGIGYLELAGKVTSKGLSKELKGTGLKWFYAQMLLGDKTDNIIGIDKMGAVATYELLYPLNTEPLLFHAVYAEYKQRYDNYRERFLENARLLWMIRELDKDGNPVHWNYKNWMEV